MYTPMDPWWHPGLSIGTSYILYVPQPHVSAKHLPRFLLEAPAVSIHSTISSPPPHTHAIQIDYCKRIGADLTHSVTKSPPGDLRSVVASLPATVMTAAHQRARHTNIAARGLLLFELGNNQLCFHGNIHTSVYATVVI